MRKYPELKIESIWTIGKRLLKLSKLFPHFKAKCVAWKLTLLKAKYHAKHLIAVKRRL